MIDLARRIATHAAVGVGAYTVGYRTAWHDRHDPASEFLEHAEREEKIKSSLLDHLMHEAYVKLAPSKVAGVGVFALTDIPANVDPFTSPNADLGGRERSVRLRSDELMRCPTAVVDHVLDFHDARHAHTVGGRLYPPSINVNARAMVTMDASWYLNHGEQANVEQATDASSDGGFFPYRTVRHVRAGEELLLDYRKALPGVYAQIQAQQSRSSAAA